VAVRRPARTGAEAGEWPHSPWRLGLWALALVGIRRTGRHLPEVTLLSDAPRPGDLPDPDAVQVRRLAQDIIATFPTCPVPGIARLGRTLRAWKAHVLARSRHVDRDASLPHITPFGAESRDVLDRPEAQP